VRYAEYDARREFFKNKQKQWLDQQMEEKRQRQEEEKLENRLYDNQILELNRMRGMLEDNFSKTKSDIVSDTKATNQQLDLERKEKERSEKEARLQYEKEEAEYLKQRGAKQDFYMDVK
jgi:predicted transcriptional regulator